MICRSLWSLFSLTFCTILPLCYQNGTSLLGVSLESHSLANPYWLMPPPSSCACCKESPALHHDHLEPQKAIPLPVGVIGCVSVMMCSHPLPVMHAHVRSTADCHGRQPQGAGVHGAHRTSRAHAQTQRDFCLNCHAFRTRLCARMSCGACLGMLVTSWPS